jgi:hypothetical protein
MKKILFIILSLIPLISFSQKKSEGGSLPEYLSNKIGQHVTFVEFEEKKDSYRVHGISYCDLKKEEYVKLTKIEIKEKYPELLNWFTIKIDSPLGRPNGTNVNNLKVIDSPNFGNRP